MSIETTARAERIYRAMRECPSRKGRHRWRVALLADELEKLERETIDRMRANQAFLERVKRVTGATP